jgi:hypothetical protein
MVTHKTLKSVGCRVSSGETTLLIAADLLIEHEAA